MVSIYENLVREYLELIGKYIVKVDVKFLKRVEKGSGWSDIDIVAIKIDENGKISECIIGEVKSYDISRKDVDEIAQQFKNKDFQKCLENMNIKSKTCRKLRKVIYCWNLTDNTRKYAESKGFEVKCFWEIVNELADFIREKYDRKYRWFYHENYPCTTLIQMIKHFQEINKLKLD